MPQIPTSFLELGSDTWPLSQAILGSPSVVDKLLKFEKEPKVVRSNFEDVRDLLADIKLEQVASEDLCCAGLICYMQRIVSTYFRASQAKQTLPREIYTKSAAVRRNQVEEK